MRRGARLRAALREAAVLASALAATVAACLTAEAFVESSTGEAALRRVSEAAHRAADTLRVRVPSLTFMREGAE